MSLLGTPVYANASTPIWVSAAGGSGNTITAPLVVSKAGAGAIPTISSLYNIFSYGGEIVAQSNAATINPISFTLADASGNQKTRVLSTGGNSYIQSSEPLLFSQIGQGSANTSLVTSAPAANADVLTVGGTVSARNLDLLDSGAAAVIGTATLTAGTVVVNTTACDVTSYVILSRTGVGASTAIGELRVSNQGANNFTVVSAQPGSPSTTETNDVSTFHWMIVNAA